MQRGLLGIAHGPLTQDTFVSGIVTTTIAATPVTGQRVGGHPRESNVIDVQWPRQGPDASLGTSEATAFTILVFAEITLNGFESIQIRAHSSISAQSATQVVTAGVFDYDTRVGTLDHQDDATYTTDGHNTQLWRATPAAGNHKYSIRVWKSGGTASYNTDGLVSTSLALLTKEYEVIY